MPSSAVESKPFPNIFQIHPFTFIGWKYDLSDIWFSTLVSTYKEHQQTNLEMKKYNGFPVLIPKLKGNLNWSEEHCYANDDDDGDDGDDDDDDDRHLENDLWGEEGEKGESRAQPGGGSSLNHHHEIYDDDDQRMMIKHPLGLAGCTWVCSLLALFLLLITLTITFFNRAQQKTKSMIFHYEDRYLPLPHNPLWYILSGPGK